MQYTQVNVARKYFSKINLSLFKLKIMELSIFSTQELQALLQINQKKIDSLNIEISEELKKIKKEPSKFKLSNYPNIKRLTKTLDTACSVQAKTKKELAQRIKTK